MILEFDLGNSAAKWRLVDGDSIAVRGIFTPPAIDLTGLGRNRPRVARAVSVAGPEVEAALATHLAERLGLALQLVAVGNAAAGVTNSYAEPSSMGADRWAAIVAAHHLADGPKVVVDAGSALTVDFVDADGRHRGGYIGVGLGMMRRALLESTQRVRFTDEALSESTAPGTTTAACVSAGTLLALRGSLTMALTEAQSTFGGASFTVFLCGGDATSLQPHLAAVKGLRWRYQPDLVFEGLRHLCPVDADLAMEKRRS